MIETITTACRLIFDVAALFLWGSGVYIATLVPAGLRETIWSRLGAIRLLALCGLIVSALLLLPVRTAAIGDGWASAMDPQMLLAIASGTNVGQVIAGQIVLTVVFAVAVCLLPARLSPVVTTFFAGMLLVSLSFSGHAAMNEGAVGMLQRANNALHLLAGGVWVGALAPVLLILVEMRAARVERKQAIIALSRFSVAGHFAVAAVVLSGVASSLLITGRFPPTTDSLYQVLLLAKIGLVLAMVGIALCNRYLFVPRLANPRYFTAFVAGTGAEIVLAMAAIGLVAYFGMLQP